MTSLFSSRSTAPCICPAKPTHATAAPGTFDSASRIAAPAAFHQSCGSCSAHPVFREAKGKVCRSRELADPACRVHEDGARAARAYINAENVVHSLLGMRRVGASEPV